MSDLISQVQSLQADRVRLTNAELDLARRIVFAEQQVDILRPFVDVPDSQRAIGYWSGKLDGYKIALETLRGER